MGDTSVDVNEEWLEAAREVLGTDTKVATINAALPPSAVRRQAVNIVAAFDSVPMDFEGSVDSWGRDLSKLVTPVPRARRDGVKPRAASANLGEDSANFGIILTKISTTPGSASGRGGVSGQR